MNHFFAYINRMRFIQRWALMRNSYTENIQEHSHQVAVLAHALAVLRNEKFGGQVDAGAVAVAALYHDAAEILTGDLPTPVKYSGEALKNAYKALEQQASARICALAPQPVQAPLLEAMTGSGLTAREKSILKAADKLSGLIKCMEEKQSGNLEFESAARAQLKALEEMHLPEADWFMQQMLPAYKLTLDELTAGAPQP